MSSPPTQVYWYVALTSDVDGTLYSDPVAFHATSVQVLVVRLQSAAFPLASLLDSYIPRQVGCGTRRFPLTRVSMTPNGRSISAPCTYVTYPSSGPVLELPNAVRSSTSV